MTVRAISIDLIDTLVSRDDRSFAEESVALLRRYKHDVNVELFMRAYREAYLEYSLGKFVDDRQYYENLLRKLNIELQLQIQEGLSKIFYEIFSVINDPIPTLAKLSYSHKLILATDFVYTWAIALLTRFQINTFFQSIVVSSTLGYRKPSRPFFEHILRESTIGNPKHCCIIGNSYEKDLAVPISMGMKAILIDPNSTPISYGDYFVVRCIAEVEQIVSMWQGEQ